jgi:hypothetical protein
MLTWVLRAVTGSANRTDVGSWKAAAEGAAGMNSSYGATSVALKRWDRVRNLVMPRISRSEEEEAQVKWMLWRLQLLDS